MFAFPLKTIMREFETQAPDLHAFANRLADAWGKDNFDWVLDEEYGKVRKISIDYAVMEHAKSILVREASFDWDDIGNWTALRNHFPMDEQGHLLTERFFFGEEDFEFSMRMNNKKVLMACVLDSQIYHKVGASSDKMQRLGKVYLHYLNRFIDIRIHRSPLFYCIWCVPNVLLCFRYFYRMTHSLSKTSSLLRRLLEDARKKEGVSKEDFEALVINNTYFISK